MPAARRPYICGGCGEGCLGSCEIWIVLTCHGLDFFGGRKRGYQFEILGDSKILLKIWKHNYRKCKMSTFEYKLSVLYTFFTVIELDLRFDGVRMSYLAT